DLSGCRGGYCPNCPVNSKYFGYYPTQWRRWPGTEPAAQAAPSPAADGVGVPLVDPPPSTEETENKTKTPATDATGGAGGTTTTPMTEPAAGKPDELPPRD